MTASPKTLLVIDDQIANFDTLVSFLENEDTELLYASSGAKAFTLLEKTYPDLILLDVMMPEMNGIEVCRKLKQ
ncbi:MAG: response regulator, partial [Microcystaceae cyanobacterium]